MSNRTSHKSESRSGFRLDDRLCLAFVAGGIILALAFAGLALRTYRLSEVPPAIGNDEAAHGIDALEVLKGKHALFFPRNEGREGMVIYLVAVAISFLGRTILAVRLPTALASSVTVVVVFWLGWILFGKNEKDGQREPWRGLFVGSVAAGLMAISIGHFSLGRIAFRANLLPLFLTLCFALLWLGWRQRNWWQIALAGLCAGLLPYTYLPARIVPVLFVFFGLTFLLPVKALTREKVKGVLPWIVVFIGVAGLVAAPILFHFALHPDHFSSRSNYLWIFSQEAGFWGSLKALAGNIRTYLSIFGFRDQDNWARNLFVQFILFPHEAAFFWLGTGVALWRWGRHPAYRLLLLWVVVLILPSVLSNIGGLHLLRTVRMVGAVPAIYLLTAVGLLEFLQFLRVRLPRAGGTNFAIAAAIVVGGGIATQGILNYRTYFHEGGKLAEIHGTTGIEWTDLAHWLNGRQTRSDTVYLIPSFHSWRFSLNFLYQGAAPVRIVDARNPDLAVEMEVALAGQRSENNVKVVEWNTDSFWIVDDAEAFLFLLGKYGRHVNSERFADFQIHTYTNISRASHWTLYDHLEPLTVRYDGGITLTGFALGQGENQLTSRRLVSLGEDRMLWTFLNWQIEQETDVDYAVSLRLYSEEGEMVYQEDNLIWELRNKKSTKYWTDNETVDSLFYLDLPIGIQSGSYDLRLVVYNFETQIPTVEIDVWQPEVTLARLHLLFPPNATANRN